MKILQPATEEEVLQSWAESEFNGSRHRDEIAPWILSYNARTRILETHPSKWSSIDRKDAIEATRRARSPILDGILKSNPSWRLVEIGPDEVGSLLHIDHPPFNALAGDRRIGTFVEALDAGRTTRGDGFSRGYQDLRKKFSPEKTLGLPGVAAKSERGPFIVFDGLTRLCILHSRLVAGEPVPAAIQLYLAVSPRLSKGCWQWL